MIKIHEAEGVLRKMLQAGKVNLQAPDVELFWGIYKEFVRTPVEVDTNPDDALLFQWGTGNYIGESEEGFYLDFTRQFCINDADGEYDHMEQLSATLLYAQPIALSLGASNFWSYDFDNSFERFIEEVESSEIFKEMRANYQPYRLDIAQGGV